VVNRVVKLYVIKPLIVFKINNGQKKNSR
jgi:hypothetical protein